MGGGTLFTKLLETPLSPLKLTQLHIVVMVDLSKPGELWFTLETLVSTLTTYLEMSLKNSSQDSEETLNKKRSSADYELHPDKDHIRPFPLPLIILGGRYDEFQNFEPEKKKIICKALRFFAHYHGASLQFYSAMDSGLVKKAKDLLGHHAFGNDPVKGDEQFSFLNR